MIKIGKLYINLLILPLLFMAAFTNTLLNTLIAYAVITVHELAHFIAAKCCKVEMGGLVIMPFGVSIKLKNNRIHPLHDTYISMAGPFGNVVMIIAALMLRKLGIANIGIVDYFILSNAAIFAINVIPILPLDGGRILRAVLTHHLGFTRASRISIAISQVNAVIVGAAGIWVLWSTHFNASIAVLCSFLIFNISAEKRNSQFTMMQELLDAPDKLSRARVMPARALVCTADTSPVQLLKHFSYNHYYMINVCDDQAKPLCTLSETQLIGAMVGGECQTVGDAVKAVGN